MRHRQPGTSWEEAPLASFLIDPSLAQPDAYQRHRQASPATFFFSAADTLPADTFDRWDADGNGPISEVQALERGSLRYFSTAFHDVGFPPRWHRNPITGEERREPVHWSDLSDSENGDIKLIWEASRFHFAYTLVRAYRRTGDERLAELFWTLVEDWRIHNAPQTGANWMCGQETSFRLMAWCFGLYGFLDADATTPERVARLGQMIAVSARRVEANLGYAISQRNNHGISEATGLWTVGLLFPEFRAAARWQALGAKQLERLGRDLIYDDGAFVQHSTNYHRVMLHDYLWALRLGDLNGTPFSAVLRERVGRAGEYLYAIQDAGSGEAPFYGHNDGALVLPLNNCAFHDLRPVVEAVAYLTSGRLRFAPGPWEEDLLWLFGREALEVPRDAPKRSDLSAPDGGCYTLRSPSGFAFVRCQTFRDRPSQADALHLDVWWRGQNMAIDAGTYSYNAPPPWDNALSRTAAHNTVEVDGEAQMDRAGRFLWLPWLRSTVRAHVCSRSGRLAYWEGEHDGYLRLPAPVLHRRGVVRLGEDHWLVLDALTSSSDHVYRLHWLLPNLPYRAGDADGTVTLDTAAGPFSAQLGVFGGRGDLSVVRASLDSARGWTSRYYMEREPAVSLTLTSRGDCTRFWSLLGPPCTVSQMDDLTVTVEYGKSCYVIRLAPERNRYLVSWIERNASERDVLPLEGQPGMDNAPTVHEV
jgi:Heparinase II/III-like protein/Heparinase II/III N-terminus